MYYLLVIIVFIAIVLIEIPDLIKKNYVRELWTFTILMVFAFVISITYIMEVKLPDPTNLIIYIVHDLFKLNYNNL